MKAVKCKNGEDRREFFTFKILPYRYFRKLEGSNKGTKLQNIFLTVIEKKIEDAVKREGDKNCYVSVYEN